MDIHGVSPLLQVFDMPTAIRFYRDVLGFQVWSRSEPGDDCNWAGLRLNGAEVMLNTAYEADQRPAVPDAKRIAAHEDPCLFFAAKISTLHTSICTPTASISRNRKLRRTA